jgi:integrase
MSRKKRPPAVKTSLSPDMPFHEACTAYLRRRARKLSPRSFEEYVFYFRSLQKFFDPDRPLSSFRERELQDYQKWRRRTGAGPSLINHELGALSRILRDADLWHGISKRYRLLRQKNLPARVMTPEEEERFVRCGRSNRGWKVALNVILIMANTALAMWELRMIRLKHLRLTEDPPVILVPQKEGLDQVRRVPLNEVSLAAVAELVTSAREHGAIKPQHYFIPYRVNRRTYNPNRQASPTVIRSSFQDIAAAAKLTWVTPSTFRRQAIVKLVTSGATDAVVRSLAGNVSQKALKHYKNVQTEATEAAVDLLGARSANERQRGWPGSTKSFPLTQFIRSTAKELGIPYNAAANFISRYRSAFAGKDVSLMDPLVKQCILDLLSMVKNLYAENYALSAMNQASLIAEIRATWESTLKDILQSRATEEEINRLFNPQIEKVVNRLQDPRAIARLVKQLISACGA